MYIIFIVIKIIHYYNTVECCRYCFNISLIIIIVRIIIIIKIFLFYDYYKNIFSTLSLPLSLFSRTILLW